MLHRPSALLALISQPRDGVQLGLEKAEETKNVADSQKI